MFLKGKNQLFIFPLQITNSVFIYIICYVELLRILNSFIYSQQMHKTQANYKFLMSTNTIPFQHNTTFKYNKDFLPKLFSIQRPIYLNKFLCWFVEICARVCNCFAFQRNKLKKKNKSPAYAGPFKSSTAFIYFKMYLSLETHISK